MSDSKQEDDTGEPKVKAGVESFVEGVEDRVTGVNERLGIVFTPGPATPEPPEHMVDHVWSDSRGWVDLDGHHGKKLVLRSPTVSRNVRESRALE